jgi:hypothetical protein
MAEFQSRVARPFNGPIETGLRSLFVLDAVAPRAHDLQRLVYYDYLLLHAGDVGGGQASLHPPIPYRAGEILVRRELIARGLELMFSKELLVKQLDETGIAYRASNLCAPFLAYLRSEYAGSLRTASSWLAVTFGTYADSELAAYMTANLGRWGAEFKLDAFLRSGQQ